jgi:hypothetical protein
VAVAALTTPQHDNKTYALTGPKALTFAEMANQLSRAVGRAITFVDVPPEAMRATLVSFGFPTWQTDGLLEEFAMYGRGEAAEVESGVNQALADPLVRLTSSRLTTRRCSLENGTSQSGEKEIGCEIVPVEARTECS